MMKVSMGIFEMEMTEAVMGNLYSIATGDHMPEAIDRVESIIISMYRGEVGADEAMGALAVLHDIKEDYELLLQMNIERRKEVRDEGD